MPTQEFEVALLDAPAAGAGKLLITDARLLIRPGTPGQVNTAPLDTAHFARVMDLGAVANGWHNVTWHVVTSMSMTEVHDLFDRAWHAYFDDYCRHKARVRVVVKYVGDDGAIIRLRDYGVEDGEAFADVYVYCREFWEALGNPDPARCDWTTLLRNHVIGSRLIHGPLPFDQLETALDQGLPYRNDMDVDRVVVVQPSSEAPGFTARGFRLIAPGGDGVN